MEEKYFDVDSALKDHSADQVATHMAQLFGIDRNAYLKDGKTDAEFLNEYKSRPLPFAETQTQTTPATINEPSNALNVISGGAAAAVPAIGKYGVHKLGDMARNALGVNPNAPAQPAPSVNVQKQFVSPEAVQQRIVDSAKPARPAGPSDVVNWSMGKETGAGQYGRGYLGGANMEQEAMLHKQADALEAANPGRKIMPGTSNLLIPESEYNRIINEKAAAHTAAQSDAAAKAQDAAELRKQRLAKTQPTTGAKVVQGALNVANKPLLNRFSTGYNTADLLQAENPFEAGVSAVGAAAPYVTPKIAKMVHPRFRGAVQAAGAAAQYGAPLVNFVERKLLGPKEEEQKAAGGLIQHYDAGSLVKGAKAAKKVVSGFLEHTPSKPNPLVGTRFDVKDLGGIAPSTQKQWEDYRDAMVTLVPYDATHRNKQIRGVSGRNLTEDIFSHGGRDYVNDVEHINQGVGGASNRAIANRIQKRTDIARQENLDLGGSGQTIMLPSSMGRGGEEFAVPTWQIYFDLFKQAEHNPNAIQQYSDALRAVSKTNPNTKVTKYPFADMLNLNDPKVVEQFLANGDMRKAFIKQQKLKDNQRILGANAEDIRAALTDPNTVNLPRGYLGGNIIETVPGAKTFPSSNITYDTNFAGKPGGHFDTGDIPAAVAMNDPYSNMFKEMQARYPDKPWQQLHDMATGALERRNEGVSQHLNEKAINRIRAYQSGLEEGKFNPGDIKGALDYLNQPGIYGKGVFAEGGSVPHLALGGNPLEAFKKLGLTEKVIEAWKAANKVSQRQTRNPILQQAAIDLGNGKITSEQYRALVREHMPIKPLTEVPQMPSHTDMASALKNNQVETGIVGVNKEIPHGTRVSSRLDIPAYDNYDQWIVSLHDPQNAGKSMGYGQAAHLAGPIQFTAPPKAGHAIATNKINKETYARIHGDWQDTHPDEVYKRAQGLMNDPEWAQVGMNPFRHSYFYDKADMSPVTGAEEVLQVGPLVLAKKPVKVSPDDPQFRLNPKDPNSPTFKKGGLATFKKKK